MKTIAIPVKRNNQIDDHFGHCEYYGIYTISDNKEIQAQEILQSPHGCGCKSNIAATLAQKGVSVMLAGGIGSGAINVLNQAGIVVIRGCRGNAEEIIQQYALGNIQDNGESCLQHEHHHGHGHGKDCDH
jgi:predicted Fe-Mo cluster-binding NifX family protein